MSIVSYDYIEKNNGFSDGGNRQFSYFSLKNNGDKAVVRILYDNPSQFKICSVHKLRSAGKFTTVNCPRSYNEPVEVCPLCESGNGSQTRFYVPMIQYFQGESDSIEHRLVIWERSLSFARTVKSLIDEYGPLQDVVFTITRDGEAGDIKTKYNVLFGNPRMYPDNVYGLDSEMFEESKNFNVVGTVVQDKSKEELDFYTKTGSFPEKRPSREVNVDIQGEDNVAPWEEDSPLPTIPEPPKNIESYNRRVAPPVSNTQERPEQRPSGRPVRYY